MLFIDEPELKKPANVRCQHLVERGCGIYENRPPVCRKYLCAWTISPHMSDAWRPNIAGFLAHRSDDGKILHIFTDNDTAPEGWRREPYYSQIRSWSVRRGVPADLLILVHSRGRMIVVFPEGEIDVGPESEAAVINSGYRNENGRSVPYAYIEPGPGGADSLATAKSGAS